MLRATPQDLVEAARSGDDSAFRLLIEPHRDRLRSHCYRILRSDHDADDALQEALLRAWRGLPGFERGSALGPWLYRIATNSSLDALDRRRRVPAPIATFDDEPRDPAAPTDVTASPAATYERREELEAALVAVLRHLSPRQRAALILSDALGFSARDAARALDTTTASVYSALQRARHVIDDGLPEQAEEPALRSLDDEQLKADVDRFTRAMERADVAAIVTLLRD